PPPHHASEGAHTALLHGNILQRRGTARKVPRVWPRRELIRARPGPPAPLTGRTAAHVVSAELRTTEELAVKLRDETPTSGHGRRGPIWTAPERVSSKLRGTGMVP